MKLLVSLSLIYMTLASFTVGAKTVYNYQDASDCSSEQLQLEKKMDRL